MNTVKGQFCSAIAGDLAPPGTAFYDPKPLLSCT